MLPMATVMDLINISDENKGKGKKSGCEYQQQPLEFKYNAVGHTEKNTSDRDSS